MFRVLDLFSGIGGFSLGLERAGFETVAFCEQDGFACRVLRKHWPTVPIFEDVRTLSRKRLKSHGIEPEIICGGFPCQDISSAGKGAGLAGKRSGLWSEFHRLIREIRPSYAIVENVPALRSRGLDRVLGDLASIGYDTRWECLPASAFGALHRRDRIWIVAYPHRDGRDLELCLEAPGRADLGDRGPVGGQAQRAGFRVVRSPEADGASQASPRVCRVSDGLPYHVDRLRGRPRTTPHHAAGPSCDVTLPQQRLNV